MDRAACGHVRRSWSPRLRSDERPKGPPPTFVLFVLFVVCNHFLGTCGPARPRCGPADFHRGAIAPHRDAGFLDRDAIFLHRENPFLHRDVPFPTAEK